MEVYCMNGESLDLRIYKRNPQFGVGSGMLLTAIDGADCSNGVPRITIISIIPTSLTSGRGGTAIPAAHRTVPLLPPPCVTRFCAFHSPVGSQSTIISSYFPLISHHAPTHCPLSKCAPGPYHPAVRAPAHTAQNHAMPCHAKVMPTPSPSSSSASSPCLPACLELHSKVQRSASQTSPSLPPCLRNPHPPPRSALPPPSSPASKPPAALRVGTALLQYGAALLLSAAGRRKTIQRRKTT